MIKIPKRLLPKGNAQNEISFDEEWVSQNDYKRNKEMRARMFEAKTKHLFKCGRIRHEEKKDNKTQ